MSSLKLVKTTGGTNGVPKVCAKCQQPHFIATGMAWHCSNCGLYVPSVLGLTKDVKKAMEMLERLRKMTNDLEKSMRPLNQRPTGNSEDLK